MCSQTFQDYLLSLVSSVWLQPRLHGVDVLLGALIGEPQSLELVLDVGQLRLKLPRFHRVLMWMLEWTNQLSLFFRAGYQLITILSSDGGAAHLSREGLGRSHFLAKVLVLDQQVGPLLLEESHLRRRKTVRNQIDGEGSALLIPDVLMKVVWEIMKYQKWQYW